MDYHVLHQFDITANPLSGDGDLRVNLIAYPVDMESAPSFYAGPGLWEGYAYHFQHAAGLEPELAAKLTEQLKSGAYVGFRVYCFIVNLENMGFRGIQRA